MMCDLEKVLKNEGVLMAFLRNFDYSFSFFNSVSVWQSFDFAKTTEGVNFWNSLASDVELLKITKRRVQELRKEYKLIPPRYKEVA